MALSTPEKRGVLWSENLLAERTLPYYHRLINLLVAAPNRVNVAGEVCLTALEASLLRACDFVTAVPGSGRRWRACVRLIRRDASRLFVIATDECDTPYLCDKCYNDCVVASCLAGLDLGEVVDESRTALQKTPTWKPPGAM